MISITDKPIDSTAVLASVSDPDCGANVLFVGTTRRMTGQRETTRLEYECYESMAVSKMESLVALAHEQWPIAKVSIGRNRNGQHCRGGQFAPSICVLRSGIVVA